MFEARLVEAGIFKRVLDAIKDLITEASFDCNGTGVQLQAMDSSHVSLISLNLWTNGFENYRCDRDMSIAMNVEALGKIMRCANNDDIMSIRAEDDPKVVTFVFEPKIPDPESGGEEEDSDEEKDKKSKKKKKAPAPLSGDRVSEFDLKLMNLDSEHLGIPDTEYDCITRMPASDFARIIRDLKEFGDSITISCSKHGIKFSAAGDIGTGNIKVAQTSTADEDDKHVAVSVKEPTTLTFASKYLWFFARAAALSKGVILSMSKDIPLSVEFKIDATNDKKIGYIRYYLAPKIEDEDS